MDLFVGEDEFKIISMQNCVHTIILKYDLSDSYSTRLANENGKIDKVRTYGVPEKYRDEIGSLYNYTIHPSYNPEIVNIPFNTDGNIDEKIITVIKKSDQPFVISSDNLMAFVTQKDYYKLSLVW